MAGIPEITNDILAHYRDVPTGLVTDALGRLGLGSWMDDVRPLNPASKVFGRIRTIRFAPRSGIKRPGNSVYSIIRDFAPAMSR